MTMDLTASILAAAGVAVPPDAQLDGVEPAAHPRRPGARGGADAVLARHRRAPAAGRPQRTLEAGRRPGAAAAVRPVAATSASAPMSSASTSTSRRRLQAALDRLAGRRRCRGEGARRQSSGWRRAYGARSSPARSASLGPRWLAVARAGDHPMMPRPRRGDAKAYARCSRRHEAPADDSSAATPSGRSPRRLAAAAATGRADPALRRAAARRADRSTRRATRDLVVIGAASRRRRCRSSIPTAAWMLTAARPGRAAASVRTRAPTPQSPSARLRYVHPSGELDTSAADDVTARWSTRFRRCATDEEALFFLVRIGGGRPIARRCGVPPLALRGGTLSIRWSGRGPPTRRRCDGPAARDGGASVRPTRCAGRRRSRRHRPRPAHEDRRCRPFRTGAALERAPGATGRGSSALPW